MRDDDADVIAQHLQESLLLLTHKLWRVDNYKILDSKDSPTEKIFQALVSRDNDNWEIATLFTKSEVNLETVADKLANRIVGTWRHVGIGKKK